MSVRAFRRLVFLALVAGALASRAAEAVAIEYSFAAVVLDTSDAPADLQLGATVTGTFVYETSATSNGQSITGDGITESYALALGPGTPILSIAFESSATAVTSSSGTAVVRDHPNGSVSSDAFVVNGFGVTSPLAIPLVQLNLTGANQPTGPISNTVLAADLPLKVWALREINFFTTYNTSLGGRIRAGITSLQTAPEPSTAPLLGGGLAALALRRRQRA